MGSVQKKRVFGPKVAILSLFEAFPGDQGLNLGLKPSCKRLLGSSEDFAKLDTSEKPF